MPAATRGRQIRTGRGQTMACPTCGPGVSLATSAPTPAYAREGPGHARFVHSARIAAPPAVADRPDAGLDGPVLPAGRRPVRTAAGRRTPRLRLCSAPNEAAPHPHSLFPAVHGLARRRGSARGVLGARARTRGPALRSPAVALVHVRRADCRSCVPRLLLAVPLPAGDERVRGAAASPSLAADAPQARRRPPPLSPARGAAAPAAPRPQLLVVRARRLRRCRPVRAPRGGRPTDNWPLTNLDKTTIKA